MNPQLEIIFMGTGCSSGIPSVPCLLGPGGPCKACSSALEPGSKNRRRVTSLLIRRRSGAGHEPRSVLIDPGKTFYEASLNWFPKYGISSVDAVLITHAHFDAVAGLDDLRAWTIRASAPLPVHLRPADMPLIESIFSYLVNKDLRTSGGTVANLEFIQDANAPLVLEGTEFTPLEVEHGVGFIANGYHFEGVCYLSDVSAIPEAAKEAIAGCDLLILDALRQKRTYGTHLTLERALDYVRELQPKEVLFVGMCHDLEHEATTRFLQKIQPQFGQTKLGLAYDGMRLKIDASNC